VIPERKKVRVFVRPGATHLCRQINGLAALAQTAMAGDPLSGHLYLFRTQDRRLLKSLYRDKNGSCLSQKRLERDKFPWPRREDAAPEISAERHRPVLGRIDFWNAHEKLSYRSAVWRGAKGNPACHDKVPG
jgi:transposase